MQIGMKPIFEGGVCYLYVACSHPSLKRGLKDSGWAGSDTSLLGRLPYCEGTFGPTGFAGVQKRYLKLKITGIVDTVPF